MNLKFLTIFLTACSLIVLATYYFYPFDKIPEGVIIDKIVVYKAKHQLIAFSKGQPVATYTIAIGKHPIGAKQYEGDLKTPEGEYTIFAKNPNSGYYKNLGISYPNPNDIEKAKELKKRTGSDIKLHGLKNGQGYIGRFHRWRDWTNGCIALTDEEIEQLYNHTPVGTKIEILK